MKGSTIAREVSGCIVVFRRELVGTACGAVKFTTTDGGKINAGPSAFECSAALRAVSAPFHFTTDPEVLAIDHPPSITPSAVRSSGSVLFACNKARTNDESGTWLAKNRTEMSGDLPSGCNSPSALRVPDSSGTLHLKSS